MKSGRARPSAAKAFLPPLQPGHSYVMKGHRVTHVQIPIDDYEQLFGGDYIAQAAAILEDPNTKWIDGEEFALQVAGRRIAEARKAKGLTQKQLGDKLGLPQSQISRIERNPDRTTVRTVKKIATALGVSVRALV